MSLRPCLYCRSNISELATECPNESCRKKNPFDSNAKALKEAAEEEARSREKLFQQVLQQAYACKECGFITTNLAAVDPWQKGEGEHPRRIKCPKCGYPQFQIQCQQCENGAATYDSRRKQFVCTLHTVIPCAVCKGLMYDKHELEWGVGWVHFKCTGLGKFLRGILFMIVFIVILIALVSH